MVSGSFPIIGGDMMAPAPARGSDGGTKASVVPKGAKDEPNPGSLDLQALTEEVHRKLGTIHSVDLQFSIHEGSGRLAVTVMDSMTGEVIREIPPSEILDLAARLDEMIGLLFDQVG